jgi:uncharacterized protein with NRDE domain
VCTVVCRWNPADPFPVQLLALRDEKRSRAFDRPGAWWPESPDLIGGRDRQAGGTWCVSSIATGTTAVVLNRPDRPEAVPGSASRGAVPLTAAAHELDWPHHLALDGMASFNLVLAGPDTLRWWWFDGARLETAVLPAGTYLFKPTGLVTEDADARLLAGRAQLDDSDTPTEVAWADWLDVLDTAEPTADPGGFLVRRPLDDGDSYETVFAQFIGARPGELRLDYLVDPASAGRWTSAVLTG